MSGSRPSGLIWLLPAVSALVMGWAVQRQHRTLQSSQVDPTTTAQATAQTLPRATEPTPIPPTATAAPSAHEDRAALQRLRAEINYLRDRVNQREQALATLLGTQRDTVPPPADILMEAVAPEHWRNVGADTPEHVMETLLWAGAGGDTDVLRPLLALDDEATAAAQALFQHLPPDLQAEYRDPTELVAWFTADAVPLMKAEIPGVFEYEPNARNVIARLKSLDDPKAEPRIIKFVARRDPGEDRWQIVVPPAAIAGYAASLEATPEPDGG